MWFTLAAKELLEDKLNHEADSQTTSAEIQNFTLFVSSWNVGGIAPPAELNMEDLLLTENSLADIYVLGFQEIVPLNAGNIIVQENTSISMQWNSLICAALNKTDATKSSISLQKAELGESHQKAAVSLAASATSRVIWLGDLNYRIYLPEPTTRSLVNDRQWTTLLQNDQLKAELREGCTFEGWNEEEIEFAPTYKYNQDSDDYYGCNNQKGKKEKNRMPAWCDRIIWFGKGLKQRQYSRGECKLSDHRPVRAIFTAEVKVQCQ
ncbi:putative protease Do-like 9-like [Capsicum annuum]|nr:putative protease Do-like 9-like [Capsicum annuum]